MSRHREARQPRDPGERGRDPTGPVPFLDLASVSHDEALRLLLASEITSVQVVPAGSNYTFGALMSSNGRGQFMAIYKPRRGENPLWDFPEGTLHRREHAAYLTSRYLGWPNIPPTVIRDGPLGVGSVQLYVPTEEEWDFNQLRRRHREELMRIALFDLLVNNADRKAGHCLLGRDGRIWSIDHGITFNMAPKLRTVLWDYCGEPIPEPLLAQLEPLRADPSRRRELQALLQPDLEPAEIEATFRRLERILHTRRYPQLDPHRNIPWPLV